MTARAITVAVVAYAVAAGCLCLAGAADGQRLHAEGTDRSCKVCHSTAVAGLRRSAHAELLERDDTKERACSVCHGDLTAHAQAAARPGERQPVIPAAVAPSSCKECHQDADYAASLGAHPWERQPAAPVPVPPGRIEEQERVDDIARHLEGDGYDWSGLFAAGYRIVHRAGSRERYRTDLDLSPGFRLRELELRGDGGSDAFADLLLLRADEIGDPWQRVEARVEKRDSYGAGAEWVESSVKYQAGGDFHRVDRDSETVDLDLLLDVSADLRLFGRFSRRTQDSQWLTTRVGSQNLSPQTYVDGVVGPTRFGGDLIEAGVTGRVAETAFTVTVEYNDDDLDGRWTFQQPSVGNPAFTDREDFASASSLRGPGVRAALRRSFGPLVLEFDGLYRDLDRRVVGGGVRSGFDVEEYTTTTTSDADGDASTLLLDLGATLELMDEVAVVGNLRWLDHEEELRIDQTDVTVLPGSGTSVVVDTAMLSRTEQRRLTGSVELDLMPVEGFSITGGWGFSFEDLELPDLEADDQDFHDSTLTTHGAIFGLEWRPDDHWTLAGRYENFQQSGVKLHEVVPDPGQLAEGRLKWRTDTLHAGTFVEYRRGDNDAARYHHQRVSTGVDAGTTLTDGTDLWASYVYTDLRNRTLTNFYFDPDPDPVPTFVGFDGRTHTLAAHLLLKPSSVVRWELTGSYSSTEGSFDVDVLDWRSDLAFKTWAGGELGIEFRQVDYAEQGVVDDYNADLVFLYWRQRLGPRRR